MARGSKSAKKSPGHAPRQIASQAHPFKRRVYEILEEGAQNDVISAWVDRALMVLIVLNVIAVVLETVPDIHARYAIQFAIFEYASVAVFSVEYGLRFWVADIHVPLRHLGPVRARINYLGDPSGVIDLAAILPFYLGLFGIGGDLRFLRVFRLVRFLKLARYSPGLRSLVNALVGESRALIATLIIMIGLILTAATVLYVVERNVQPEVFGSIPAAIWWSVATLTTVGYGDVVPVTILGKSIGVVVMVLGLAMFALPIGIVATAFAQEIHRRDFVVTWGMVARVPLFMEFSAAEIAEVMKLLHARKFERQTFIAHEGDEAHSMYFIASGTVEVQLPDGPVILSDGMFFGEIALLRKSRRSANVLTVTPVNLLVLDAADLHSLMERKPEMARQLREVAQNRMGGEPVTPQGDIAAEELKGGEKSN